MIVKCWALVSNLNIPLTKISLFLDAPSEDATYSEASSSNDQTGKQTFIFCNDTSNTTWEDVYALVPYKLMTSLLTKMSLFLGVTVTLIDST